MGYLWIVGLGDWGNGRLGDKGIKGLRVIGNRGLGDWAMGYWANGGWWIGKLGDPVKGAIRRSGDQGIL